MDCGAAGGTEPKSPVPVSGHWGGRVASAKQENHSQRRVFRAAKERAVISSPSVEKQQP